MNLSAYLRLMRLDKPVGIWLLWAPTAWALWLSSAGGPKLSLIIYFFAGTVLMRSSGCVVNDIADRGVDKYVQRTKLRPLTCGEITLTGALGCLFGLLFMSAWILVQLPRGCIFYALLAGLLMVIYPLTKRFFKAPQLVLGLAFSVSIPMAYTAVGHALDGPVWWLCGLNITWILIYDTVYALVDRDDDLQLGLNSTAILIRGHEQVVLRVLSVILHGLWLIVAVIAHLNWWFYLIWILGAIYLVHQDRLLIYPNSHKYFQVFKNNVWYGLLMWIGLM